MQSIPSSEPRPEPRPEIQYGPEYKPEPASDFYYDDSDVLDTIAEETVISSLECYRATVLVSLLMNNACQRQLRIKVEAKANDTRAAIEVLRRFYPDKETLIGVLKTQFTDLVALIATIDEVSMIRGTTVCATSTC